ncbi:MAG: recombination mediator RecR [candidate division WOR-3 bacterium]|uniref:Recombination protein RecR n=1 Tax=candidate division WOR-3 bacterium TaxID=2052148 RepID=A0A7C2AQ28_UNCW3|nr:recombination mediator RecR [candidate division WOR-3 bacterium]
MNSVFESLLAALSSLPGIGRKSAQRLAFHLLKNPELARQLTTALNQALEKIHLCPVCFNLTENEICTICTDPKRDHSLVCVVEEPADVLALEQTGQFHGTYHVLGGVLAPLDRIGPENLHIRELLARIEQGKITEVILATNPTVEGEASAVYLARQLKPFGVRVTRIARGLPVGSELELADRETLGRALEGRKEL